MIYAVIILVLTSIYTFYMGYTNGSNAVATTIVTRAMKPRLAIFFSAGVHFVAAIVMYFLTTDFKVAETIGTLMIDKSHLQDSSLLGGFVFLLSGMLSATIWGVVTYFSKLPNSTTHTLLGGIIGAGMAAFGIKAVKWNNVLYRIIIMIILAPLIAVAVGYVINKLIKRIARRAPKTTGKAVTVLQWINVAVLSVSFSINNVQKSIGVYMLLVLIGFALPATPPFYIVAIFALMLALGMLFGGYKIIITVGIKLFKLKPIHSLSSQISTSIVIFSASALGLPIGTGQIMSSAVVGIGVSERISGVNWRTVKRIVMGWLVTIPVTIGLGALCYLIINSIMGGVA